MKGICFGLALLGSALAFDVGAQAPSATSKPSTNAVVNRPLTNALNARPLTNALTRQQQEGLVSGGIPASNFTPEQRAKLQDASKKLQSAQTSHYQRMGQIRRELEEMGKKDVIDESAIREKAKEIGTIEGELAILRAHHYKELKTILPKEQFDALQSAPAPRPAMQQRLNSVVDRVERTNALSTNRPSRPPTNSIPVKR
jgi:Spy/CpxP family protein refolding chaperone